VTEDIREGGAQNGKRILLITGGYYPAPGGAANYSHTLAHLLTDQGVAREVEVFTERYPGEPMYKREGPASRVIVRRPMPWRATRDRRGILSGFFYVLQLLQIAAVMLKEARRYDAILLHGSLVYRTGFLARIVEIVRRWVGGWGPRFILDIRDPLLPVQMASLANRFDKVVACAQNVSRDLAEKGVHRHKIYEIPIPLSPHPAKNRQQTPMCVSHGLKEGRFAFVAHGFTPGKRTEEVVDAVAQLRESGMDLPLAVAGKARFWPDNAEQARQEGWLHFLGPLPNSQIRTLMAECRIHINVCAEEGMPRGSLEAIAAGALTILPPGVPEFEEYCPEWIGTAGDPQHLAKEIKAHIQKGGVAPYPVENHTLEAVAKGYSRLFQFQR
jgi:glycosyltransferase involved in cell wall biosynthesis